MQKKNLCLTALAASAVLVGTHAASADVLALYDFSEFTNEQADSYYNPGSADDIWTYENQASSPLGSATVLTNEQMASLVANTTRDSTNEPVGPISLLMAAGALPSDSGSNVPPPPASDDNYLGFSVTADQNNIGLTDLSFDLGTSIGANQIATSGDVVFDTLETNAQLFYSTDGTTFNPIGGLIESVATSTEEAGEFTGMNTYSIDLSSLDLLDTGESIDFRLGLSDNRGGGTTTMGHYLDNVMLEGVVIPEPTSVALFGLAGLGLLRRRRA